ncbi:hypothetical protein EXIGLDRAFT_765821 [Exidia glandulosa HHB12029]|uniref:F-box domain-containing protein n=1 Tax=Exidia glandulosa HHB12029 TaxID=1314781 RepID=A0A165K6N6_EXIGL|nr:hypothetical protein EXIGLDRAFT_765821 [Exidia glandulosa HHB12029]
MLLVDDERALSEHITSLAVKCIPIIAYNGHGLIADSVLVEVLDVIQSATRRVLERFSQQRNSSASINRLPPEVLVLIGSFVPYGSLCSAVRVCRHWHKTLLSASSIWDDVVISFQSAGELAESALQTAHDRTRGRIRRLTISATSHGPLCGAAPKICASVMEHMVDLQLDLHDGFCTDWTTFLVNTPAPRLRTLSLTGPCRDELFLLPDNLLAGVAPELTLVWLTYVLLPAEPGPALADVTEIAYFDVPLMTTAEVQHICRVCPKLKYLTITARAYDIEPIGPNFVAPKLASLCLNGIIPEGIVDAIVRANTKNMELRINMPAASGVPIVLTRIRHIREIHIYGTRILSRAWATVMVTGDDDYTICVEGCLLTEIIDILRVAGPERLASVPSLTISDGLLVVLQTAGVMYDFSGLKHLTVLLENCHRVPSPQLFTGYETRFATAVETVRLASDEQYSFGFKHEYSQVSLSADVVRHWLPLSVKRLILCGVQLDGSPDCRPSCDIVSEWETEGRHGNGIWMDTSWSDWFPHDAALYV